MRRPYFFFLLVLFASCMLFGRAGVSFALKTAIRQQLGQELSYREARLGRGTLVLEDAVFSNRSYDLQAKEVKIALVFAEPNHPDLHPIKNLCSRALKYFQIPLPHVVINQPHLIVRDWRSLQEIPFKEDWSIHIKEGVFEWKEQEVSKRSGLFSFYDRKLHMKLDDGSLIAEVHSSGEENNLACAFEDWPIGLFTKERDSSDFRGLLSGELQVGFKDAALSKVSGALCIKDGWFDQIGAKQITWEGNCIFSDEMISACRNWKDLPHFLEQNLPTLPHQMNIRFQDAWIDRGESGLTSLQGTIFSNQGVGLRWEVHSPSFEWDGKWFFQSRISNWLLSSLKVGEATGSLQISQLEGGDRRYSLEVVQADRKVAELIQTIWPQASWKWEAGVIEGKWEWVDPHLMTGCLAIQEGQGRWGSFSFSQLQGEADLVEGAIHQAVLRGFLQELEVEAEVSGTLSHSFFQVNGKDGTALQGQFEWEEETVRMQLTQGDFAGIECAGEAQVMLHEPFPFTFLAREIQGPIDELAKRFGWGDCRGRLSLEEGVFRVEGELFRPLADWMWNIEMPLFELEWGPFQEGQTRIVIDSQEKRFECSRLEGIGLIGSLRARLRGVELRMRENGSIAFDLRLENRLMDIARIKGEAEPVNQGFSLLFEEKSHLFDMPLEIQECLLSSTGEIELFKLSHRLNWNALENIVSYLQEFNSTIGSLLELPIQGACLIECSLSSEEPSSIRIRGEEMLYENEPIAVVLEAIKQEEWEVKQLQIGPFSYQGSFKRDQIDQWKVDGSLHWNHRGNALVTGTVNTRLKCDLAIEGLAIDLEEFFPLLEGRVEGRGFCSIEYGEKGQYTLDLHLSASNMRYCHLAVDQARPLQLHLSSDQGVEIRGVDFWMSKESSIPWVRGRIGRIHYDFLEQRWRLYHAQLRLPIEAMFLLKDRISMFPPPLLKAIECIDVIECVANLDVASDFSSFSCSMREGFIPVLGQVRHVQNVELQCTKEKSAVALQIIHQGHPVHIGATLQFDPDLSGTLTLEDEEQSFQEHPLTISWGWQEGLVLHSIEGSFGGVEASFHEEVDQSPRSLIGSAHIEFGILRELLPSRIAKVFHQLKMGSGYELKGRLLMGKEGLSELAFRGLLSGKSCELFGYTIRTLLAQIEATPSEVILSNVKGSDSAGLLKIEEIKLSQQGDAPWAISMPLFRLQEFRPSLLQKVHREVGPIGPFVVREFKLTGFQGELEESQTYTAQGEMTFINSFKREHTVFDLPADVLGRIFGLDLELLIPVKGKILFQLKEDRFWLEDLQDAYSEGKRSEFFLVKEGLSPSVDLNGQVNIFVQMKQYVLFAITERFLLTLDGTLDNLSYHLQKKSKVLGRWDR